jgi:hypothetical protein
LNFADLRLRFEGWFMRRRMLETALVALQLRIVRLEQIGSPAWIPGLVWIETLDPTERNAMSPDDRIVEDFYLNEKGSSVMICERMTHDLSDVGREFADGSWDRSRLPSTCGPPKGVIWTKSRGSR